MIPIHDLALVLPEMDAPGFARLRADIAANGLREKIVVWNGAIIDGRHRYRALIEARMIAPQDMPRDRPGFFRTLDVSLARAVAFVVSANLQRRHLTESQRALVAARLAGWGRKPANLPVEADDAPRVTPHPGPFPAGGERGEPAASESMTLAAAAQMVSVSERSARSAKKLLAEAPAGVVAEVTAGATAVSAALKDVTAARAEAGPAADAAAIQAAYDQIKQEKAQRLADKKAARERRAQDVAAGIVAANAALAGRIEAGKTYGVILADPEWRFETWSAAGQDRAAENHYPCSSIAEICARPVGRLAARDCVLLLWATAPGLMLAISALEAWGFSYKTHLIWDKGVAGTGYWLRNQHEMLIIAVKGEPVCPAMGTQWPSIIAAPRGAHSEKPDAAHRFAEAFWPDAPKLEMNARAARPGWDVWGAEAPEGAA